MVALHQLVAVVADPRLSLELRRGIVGCVPHGERQVEEEWLPGLFLPPHEVDRLGDELGVDLGAHLRREGLHGPQWPAGRRLDDLRTLRQELCGRRRDRVRQLDRADVGRRVPGDVRRNAVELVEAVRRRQALRINAEVPLSEDCRGVTGILEQLTHRVRLGGERVARAREDDQRQAVADRILPGHQRGPRRRAGRLDQVLRQPQPLAGQLVEARRRRAPQLSTAIGAEVAVPHVVGENEDDVGLLLLLGDARRCRSHQEKCRQSASPRMIWVPREDTMPLMAQARFRSAAIPW